MKNLAASLVCVFISLCSFLTQAQVVVSPAPAEVYIQATPDIDRARINRERMQLDAAFAAENAACYRKFMVNNCLSEVKERGRGLMADLRRQELSINEQERKARAADQVFKTEQKGSLEKQEEAAERRAASLKEFDERMARETHKSADRAIMQSNEKSNSDAAADRAKSNAAKVAPRTQKQAVAAQEARKFNERQEKARERQEQHDRDQAGHTSPAAKPLPRPE